MLILSLLLFLLLLFYAAKPYNKGWLGAYADSSGNHKWLVDDSPIRNPKIRFRTGTCYAALRLTGSVSVVKCSSGGKLQGAAICQKEAACNSSISRLILVDFSFKIQPFLKLIIARCVLFKSNQVF